MSTTDPYEGTTSEQFTPEHLQAIGQFVTTYGNLESQFIDAFIRYSGIPVDIARAALGGSRVKDIIAATKRVMAIRKVDEKAVRDFNEVQTLFDPISTFRDKVVHRVWLVNTAKGPVVMNVSGAKSIAGIVQEAISTDDLKRKNDEAVDLGIRTMRHSLTLELWQALPWHYRLALPPPWPDKSNEPAQSK
jgi:hypothetical protein